MVVPSTQRSQRPTLRPDLLALSGRRRRPRNSLPWTLTTLIPLTEADAAKTVFQVFKTAFYDNGDIQNVDFEFSERNGQILIARILEDAQTNAFIAKEI